MKYAHFLYLLAIFISGCTSEEDRVRARVEALPELPADVADQLDSTTMAQRHLDLGMPIPTAPAPVQAPTANPHRACCSIKVFKRLKVYMLTTWCINPIDDLIVKPRPDQFEQGENTGKSDDLIDKPRPDRFEQGENTAKSEVRHYKLTSLRGKRFAFPFWCQTSNGPWDADFVYDIPCADEANSRLVVSTPGGLVVQTWSGGEANKPGTFTVIECTQVGTQRSRCGISTCNCDSSFCGPTEQCATCPTF